MTPTLGVPETAEMWGQKDEDCLSRENNRITIEKEGNSAGYYTVKMDSGDFKAEEYR